MGINSSKSTSTIDTTTKIMTDILVKMSQSCSASTDSSQSAIFKNTKGPLIIDGFLQESKSTINLSCIQGTDLQNTFSNEVSEKLTTDLNAKITGLGIGINKATAESAVKSVVDIALNVKIEDIKNCMISQKSKQEVIIEDSENSVTVKNFKQITFFDLVSTCIQQSKSLVDASNKLDTIISTKADSSIAGLALPDFLALAGGLGVCCILSILFCVFIIFTGGGGDK